MKNILITIVGTLILTSCYYITQIIEHGTYEQLKAVASVLDVVVHLSAIYLFTIYLLRNSL